MIMPTQGPTSPGDGIGVAVRQRAQDLIPNDDLAM